MFQELYKLPVLFHFLNLKIIKSTWGGVTASLFGAFVVDLSMHYITATFFRMWERGVNFIFSHRNKVGTEIKY